VVATNLTSLKMSERNSKHVKMWFLQIAPELVRELKMSFKNTISRFTLSHKIKGINVCSALIDEYMFQGRIQFWHLHQKEFKD
jgi:hypothetical protein